MNIASFLDSLDRFSDSVPLEELKKLMSQVDLKLEDIDQHVRFDDSKYQRNLLRRTENFEALLLCFEPGQRTPIHDHAGSACGVKVVLGEGVETVFEPTEDGWLYATGSTVLPEGGVVGSVDMDIHQLSNLQPNRKRLVTLHVYSPPLGDVGNYSIENNRHELVTAESRVS